MKKLQWDSDFWGIEIIHLDNSNDMILSEIANESYMIQALANVSNVDFINYLESKGFNFVESKITLQKQRYSDNAIEYTDFKDIEMEDLSEYRDGFYGLFGHNSRYSVFTKEKINEFYYTWMINSIKGKMDDKCIGYFLEDKLAGFVTYRIKSCEITIGLLGVMTNFQGKGISQKLLNYIDNIALQNNINNIKIATQGKNLRALNAYIKNGYNIFSINHWYYLKKGAKFNDTI